MKLLQWLIGKFILTVKRSLPNTVSKYSIKKKVHIKAKKTNYNMTQLVYSFSSFDDFCSFANFFYKNNFKVNILADFVLLYEYKGIYYLVLNGINLSYPYLNKLLYSITEFASFVKCSDIFLSKLLECGNLVMKHNAIKTCNKFFSN